VDIDYSKTADRMPPMAARSDVPPNEAEDYDYTADHARNWVARIGDRRPRIDGEVYQRRYYEAWTNTPTLFRSMWSLGRALQSEKGKPGQYGLTDHEMIDIVLALDPPRYTVLLPGHTATAISAGVRIEAIEALADGREEELTEEERLQVDFIRAVRDMTMTDDLWNRMVERLGSVRGAVYFAYFVCYLRFGQQMMQVFGSPAVEMAEWREFLNGIKEGRTDPVPMTHDYVWEHKPRPTSAHTD
jgi:hypothetical protein